MASSFATSAFHGTRNRPAGPSSNCRFMSAYDSTENVYACCLARALSKSDFCMDSSAASACALMSSKETTCFSPPVRCATTHVPAAASRGPTSMRRGTPFRSHSKYLAPGRMLSRSSTLTLSGLSDAATRSTASLTSFAASKSFFFGMIGTMTTCVGAILGGSTRPASSECVITSAPMSLVETPQDVAQTSSRPASAVWNWTSNAFAKFWPRKWEVPDCSAHPFGIRASMVKVSSAPANRSEADLTPLTTGMASMSWQTEAYVSNMPLAHSTASSELACAVWPSCQRNSADRRNGRVRISHRTTLAHWLIFRGRSRCELIHLPNMYQMIVSEVGRMISGSSSNAAGSGSTPPLPSARRRWCVTTAHSFAKPSTCSASLDKNDCGMSSGK
mmetsp:Transcript_19826/g.67080  ORF Transcript_19826/g.67080 Transcript_19826/m.67080 type:complete len:389 (+) Transcript_19826:172-1338(+)